MPRRAKGLTALQVKHMNSPGKYADGGGLYLVVSAGSSKSWCLRYSVGGRRREMGLGSIAKVSLAKARELAKRAELSLWDGLDPIELAKGTDKPKQSVPTFEECAKQVIADKCGGWTNPKSEAQWHASLECYAYPAFGALPVCDVTTELVHGVLEPIWLVKAETASRVRGRIETILDWATTRKYRTGDNPARLKGHLDNLLPNARLRKRPTPHAALPWAKAPDFYASLGQMAGTAAQALKLTILTAARSGEVRGARWDEFDLENKVWVIPAERMKARVEHRVPLSDAACAILERIGRVSEFVFATPRGHTPFSDAALSAVLRRMDAGSITVHGFRSTFRDWCSDYAQAPREIAESALAHTLTNKAEASYARSDHLERRRELMARWASFLIGE